MDRPLHVEEEWHIIFEEGSYRDWLINKLEPGYTHCYAVKLSEHGHFWMIVNPRMSHLQITQEPVNTYPTIRSYVGPDCTIITVKAIMSSTRPRGTLCWFNCVEVVKALIGVKSFWTLTPWQLYNYLIEVSNEHRQR